MSADPMLPNEQGQKSAPREDEPAATAAPAERPAAAEGLSAPPAPGACEASRSATDAFRSTVGARLDTLVSEVIAMSEAHAQRLKDQVRAAIDGAAAAWTAQLRAVENGQAEQQLRTAVDDARIVERECDLECMARLVDAVRDLDAANSLTDILDRVLAHAAAFAGGRAATFVVRDGVIKGWKARGFDEGQSSIADVEIRVDDPSVVAAAARVGEPRTTRDADNVCLDALIDAPLAEDRVALALPMLVGGASAAVLYADDMAGTAQPNVPSAWPEALEILARHAGCCLEKLTVATAYGLHTVQVASSAEARLGPENVGRVSEESRPEGLRRPEIPGSVSDSDDEEEAAQRYARLLVSEIKLYHEDAVNEGRLHGDLLARLEGEILRARQLYEQRVPITVRTRSDYFGQELIRTLANGDARLLGQAR